MKQRSKVIGASIATIAMCASLAVGGTFALFTSESEVNVAVTSGTVDVKATADKATLKYTSSLGKPLTESSAAIEKSVVKIDKIVPGDTISFDLVIENHSNVTVQYQTVLSLVDGVDLFTGLQIEVDKKVYDGMTAYSNWTELKPIDGENKEFDRIPVTITLPESAGDEYQTKTAEISFIVKAVQGNAAVEQPASDENTLYVYNENDMKLFAHSVNKGNNFSGKTVMMMSDIDLNNEAWTPIGNSANNFQGTFDGNGKTVSNLKISGYNSNVGLFGLTTNGAVKNVTVKNADVSGRLNVGVVAGTPYTSTYDNITILGDIKVNGMSYVGGVFGKNVYANVSNVTVNANAGSYVKADSVEDGTAYRTYVGGVIGFMGEGSHTVLDVVSNIDVIGSTCDVGGIAGIAHYGNNFVNCSSSGDVEITGATEAADALEIGGIAGVWHNGGANVTFTKCTYTGTLKTNIEVEYANNGLVGKQYEKGNGMLVIDGVATVYRQGNGALESVFTEDLLSKEDIIINLGNTNVEWTTGASHGSTPLGKEGTTMSVTISGQSPESSTFTATGDGVGPIRVEEGTLIIQNVTIIDKSESYAENNWEFGYLEFGDGNNDTLVFENCVFKNAIQISGSATFKNCKFNSNIDSEYAVWVDGGNASFEDCYFTGPRGLKMHEAYDSEVVSVTVENCKFENLTKKPGIAMGTLNAATSVTIKNSEFIDCQAGDQGLYIYETDTEVTTFTFVNENNVVGTSATVSNNTELDTAIQNGAVQIVLGSGNYIIPDSAQGKTLTIIGNGETVVATQDDGSYEGCDYSLDGATVTFENITINTDSTTYTGYARLKATYNNCTINGTYTLYDDSVFNNCTFNVSGDVYNIWTWGAPTVEFNNCTFNSDGKAVLLYGTADTKLTVNNCVFNDKGGLTDLKAAIEIGNDYSKSYTLKVTKTTVNGYEINDKGINTGTTLWANKNSMGTDKLNVIVDDVDVY